MISASQTNSLAITATVSQFGYEICVMNRGITVNEYNAGNSPHDSIQVLPLSDPFRLKPRRLKTLALRTARELADEHGIPKASIELEYYLT